MKNKQDRVIYVGKAKNLKSRVSSYFNESSKSAKTSVLVSHIVDFEFVLTQTDVEAFVLENNLIKKHSPKYNIRLRDDKSYPYIFVDLEEPFPRIQYQRRVKRGRHKKVFGPFVQGSQISEVLRILVKSFELRDCSLREFKSRKKPCLLYQLHQCSAPCVDFISADDYQKNLELALSFFEGDVQKKGTKVFAALEDRMKQAASKELFEKAAMIRDNIMILQNFINGLNQQKNIEITGVDKNIDIIAFHSNQVEVDVAIYMVRNSLLLGHKLLHFSSISQDHLEDEMMNFIFQYYVNCHDQLPSKIVLNLSANKRKIIASALKESLELKDGISVVGETSKFKDLLRLVNQYATEGQRVRLKKDSQYRSAHQKLKELLELKKTPERIECYDVAIWQGDSPTASQVVFVKGRAEKKDYRYYHLSTRAEQNNDYEMLKEFLSRRLESDSVKLPDLIIVDGGKGQVSALKQVLLEKSIEIPVVGIAKSRTKSSFQHKEVARSQERLIIPGRMNAYQLERHPELLRLVVQMRDEAHRFSRKLHHKSEVKRIFKSWCDEIDGIGEKTKEKILSVLDFPPENLALMEEREIQQSLNVSRQIALKLQKYWLAKKNQTN